jgi:hypothetical protein
MTEKVTQKQPESKVQPAPRKPNETGTISVEGFVKIFDPNSKETFVEKRA